jgi:peptidyl-prolyl cis-trans isomerase D
MIRFLQTPGPLKKILLGGLLLIICVMMVVTLVPGGILNDVVGGTASGVIAKIGSQEVTATEVQKQAQQMAKQQFPRGFPQQFMSFFTQRAADGLIMQNVVLYEAEKMGLAASKDELVYELQHGPLSPQIYPGGQFIGQDAYANLVSTNFQLSIPDFEETLRKQLTIRKVRAAIEGGVTASNTELMDEFKRQNVKVKFDYAVLTLDDVSKSINPSESELKAFYEQNKASFTDSIPEQRKARYIEVKLANPPRPTPQEIQDYYKSHQDQFRVPESVNIRHILIKFPAPGADGKVDQKAVDAARAKAEDILKQAKSGANFAELAKKNSDDPGSKEKGGLYEGVIRGQMVPEFEKAAFSTPKGQITGPVQTNYGFHVIKVEDKVDAHLKPLDEVRNQIEPVLAQQKVQSELERLARTVEAESRTQGMEKAAASKGLQLVNTEFFANGAALPGIGNSPDFMNAVFSQKPNSPPSSVRTATGFAIVQTTDMKPAATPTFEQVRDKVAQQFKQQRGQSLLAQKAQELSDRARAEHNLKAAAKAVGATIKTSELVGPGQQVPQIGQLTGDAAQIFEMKPGEISTPVASSGSGVVMQLVQKQEPAAAEFDAKKDEIRDSVLARKRGEIIELWASNLRQKMEKDGKLKINQKELARLTGPTQNP